jgi:hypothetical protein
MLGRLAIRYPEVPVSFAGYRKFAEVATFAATSHRGSEEGGGG